MSSGRCGVNITYPENELIVIKVIIYLHNNVLTICLWLLFHEATSHLSDQGDPIEPYRVSKNVLYRVSEKY